MEDVKKRKEAFSIELDMLAALLLGLVCYCILLVPSFWNYQEGRGRFSPFLCAGIIVLAIACEWLMRCKNNGMFILFLAVAAVVWFAFAQFFTGGRIVAYILGEGLVIYAALRRYLLRRRDVARRRRFLIWRYYMFYGVAMWVCSVVVILDANPVSGAYPISVKVCVAYMAIAFLIYLVAGVMHRYWYEEYQHFRTKTKVYEGDRKKTRKVNTVVLVLALVLLGSCVFLADSVLARAFAWVFQKILQVLLSLGILAMDKLSLQKVYDMFGVSGGTDSQILGKSDYKPVAMQESSPYIGMVILAVAALIVFIVFLRNYKRGGAQYEIGEDEAEYVSSGTWRRGSKEGKTTADIPKFDLSNAGKIRRIYYKEVTRRLSREEAVAAHYKTPQEIKRYLARGACVDAETLTQCYEKARYAGECTKEDVLRARESVRKEV